MSLDNSMSSMLFGLLASTITVLNVAFPDVYKGLVKIIEANKGPEQDDDNESKKGTGSEALDNIIAGAGYAYDPEQDIFYSIMNPWQREMGYCRLYDEAAAPLGMIVDCETIYFEYEGKQWLIEFWKGQFDLVTGCEIGVYNTREPELNIPGFFSGSFYEAAHEDDLLDMSYVLYKNGEKLFEREDKHWWLSGFKLGEFSEPSELSADISITLKDENMRDAFVDGLIEAGYLEEEISIDNNTVSLRFDKPRTAQPLSRTAVTDWVIQRKNELLCNTYRDITKDYTNLRDKMRVIQQGVPNIYLKILNMGKNRSQFKAYNRIKNYLN